MVKMSYDGDDLCDHLHLSYSPASKSSPPEPHTLCGLVHSLLYPPHGQPWLQLPQTTTTGKRDKSALPICTHYNFHADPLLSPGGHIGKNILVLRDLLFLHIIMFNECSLRQGKMKAPRRDKKLTRASFARHSHINHLLLHRLRRINPSNRVHKFILIVCLFLNN